jgi:hypothetical protein
MYKLNSINFIYVIAIIAVFAAAGIAQEKSDKMDPDCPMMKKEAATTPASKDMSKHPGHNEMVMANGEKAMGFSQTATTHHFLIMKDGGAIQVEANDAGDTVNRDKIRMHLTEIARQFKSGVFTTPFAVHGQVPPGVPEMDQLKEKIDYTYEETPNGARVRISTKDEKALAAIHAFLKFQIGEHMTGDPTDN